MALTRLVPRSDFWQLALLSLGHPSIIAFHAALPASAAPSLTLANVERAASHLLNKYPLLRCGLQTSRDATSSLRMRQEVLPSEVVEVQERSESSSTELLTEALEGGGRTNWDQGPLWRVKVVRGESTKHSRATRLVLSIAHLISDGVGARRLFAELLGLLKSSQDSLPPVSNSFPPAREDMDCFTPSSAFVHLGNTLTADVAYPLDSLPPVLPYSSLPPAHSSRTVVQRLVTLSPAEVTSLKAHSRANGVSTLQSLLHATALAALSLAFTSPSPNETFTLKSFTDVSFRDERLGHPSATGSYAYSIPTHRWRCYTRFPFWVLCRWYQQELMDPSLQEEGAREAGYDWGKGKGNRFVYGVDEMVQRTRRDLERGGGWCWSTTAATSNLGVLEETGWEGELGDVCWAQTAVPGCSAVLMNVSSDSLVAHCFPYCLRRACSLFLPSQALSAKGGDLTITAIWRAGTLEQDCMECFYRHFSSIIDVVARGEMEAMAEIEEFRR